MDRSGTTPDPPASSVSGPPSPGPHTALPPPAGAPSAPGEPLAITVERLEDGEVSPYLAGELRAGDELELRGPIGGYFVWEPGDGGPLTLLAGLMADPFWDVKDDDLATRGFVDHRDDRRQLPGQSPW